MSPSTALPRTTGTLTVLEKLLSIGTVVRYPGGILYEDQQVERWYESLSSHDTLGSNKCVENVLVRAIIMDCRAKWAVYGCLAIASAGRDYHWSWHWLLQRICQAM